jgi:hypothetical protein
MVPEMEPNFYKPISLSKIPLGVMDKSWIHEPRASSTYLNGLDNFLDFAFHNVAQESQVLCPCKKCNNRYWGNREEVFEHLVCT